MRDALTQEAHIFRLPEVELIAAVIGLALRFGGRADMVLERMAGFMRDREHAQQELMALSAEIRLSAWILGLLPVALSTFLIIFNNNMFMMMLADPVGEKLLIGFYVVRNAEAGLAAEFGATRVEENQCREAVGVVATRDVAFAIATPTPRPGSL